MVVGEQHVKSQQTTMFSTVRSNELSESEDAVRAVTVDRLGDPAHDPGMLSLNQRPEPKAGAGEAVVRVVLASINPSDFHLMTGELHGPFRTTQGQIAGACGVGFVETPAEVGPPAGTLVAFTALGAWADYVAVPAASLIALPPDFPLELGAQFPNLVTAWELVEKCGVKPGGWLALTAGYSTVAVAALQLAARRGIRVLCVVRNASSDVDLAALGAEAVIATGDNKLGEAVLEATGGAGLNGIVDCVAGSVTGELIRQCAPFSRMQIYGSLDSGNINIAGHDILYRFLEIVPYTYPFSFAPLTTPENIELVRRVEQAVLHPRLFVPVGGIHPIAEYRDAVAGATMSGQRGKRFLSMVETSSLTLAETRD
jgi:NADPH:quinone reductase-like Zn-dependent oxidoreductase